MTIRSREARCDIRTLRTHTPLGATRCLIRDHRSLKNEGSSRCNRARIFGPLRTKHTNPEPRHVGIQSLGSPRHRSSPSHPPQCDHPPTPRESQDEPASRVLVSGGIILQRPGPGHHPTQIDHRSGSSSPRSRVYNRTLKVTTLRLRANRRPGQLKTAPGLLRLGPIRGRGCLECRASGMPDALLFAVDPGEGVGWTNSLGGLDPVALLLLAGDLVQGTKRCSGMTVSPRSCCERQRPATPGCIWFSFGTHSHSPDGDVSDHERQPQGPSLIRTSILLDNAVGIMLQYQTD